VLGGAEVTGGSVVVGSLVGGGSPAADPVAPDPVAPDAAAALGVATKRMQQIDTASVSGRTEATLRARAGQRSGRGGTLPSIRVPFPISWVIEASAGFLERDPPGSSPCDRRRGKMHGRG